MARGRPRKSKKYPELKEGEILTSTSLKNAVRVKCAVCDKLVEMSGMGAHVNNVHYIDDLSFWEKCYGSFESNLEQAIYHQCALCDSPKFFLVDLVEIAKHMKLHPSTSPKTYISKHFNQDASLKIVKHISPVNNELSPNVRNSQLPITQKSADKIKIPPSVTLKMISSSSTTTSASKIVAQTPSKKISTPKDPMTPPFSPAAVSPTVASTKVSTPSAKSPSSSTSSVFLSPSNSPGTVKLSMRGKSVKKEKIELVKTSPVKRKITEKRSTNKKRITEETISQKFEDISSSSHASDRSSAALIEEFKDVKTSHVKRTNTEKNSTNKERTTEETTSDASSDVSDRSSADLIEKVKGGNYTTEDLLAAVASLCGGTL